MILVAIPRQEVGSKHIDALALLQRTETMFVIKLYEMQQNFKKIKECARCFQNVPVYVQHSLLPWINVSTSCKKQSSVSFFLYQGEEEKIKMKIKIMFKFESNMEKKHYFLPQVGKINSHLRTKKSNAQNKFLH